MAHLRVERVRSGATSSLTRTLPSGVGFHILFGNGRQGQRGDGTGEGDRERTRLVS